MLFWISAGSRSSSACDQVFRSSHQVRQRLTEKRYIFHFTYGNTRLSRGDNFFLRSLLSDSSESSQTSKNFGFTGEPRVMELPAVILAAGGIPVNKPGANRHGEKYVPKPCAYPGCQYIAIRCLYCMKYGCAALFHLRA